MSTVALVVSPEERAAQDQESSAIATTAQGLTITDQPSFEAAANWLRDVVLPIKRKIADTFRPRIQQAHDLHKGLLADEKRFLGPVAEAERIVRGRLATYELEVDRQRREAEAAARREQERLEAEEQARVETENRRLQAEVEEQRLAEAAAAEAAGDMATAERLVTAPVEAPVVAPRPVFVPPPAIAAPRAEGVSFRDEWDFEIVNAALIPREYLIPDEKKIRGVVRALRGATRIPGIKAISKRVTAIRG